MNKLPDNMAQMTGLAPIKAGLFWAKGKNSESFNLIAHIIGSAPYLRLGVYDTETGILHYPVPPSAISEWGPAILFPDAVVDDAVPTEVPTP